MENEILNIFSSNNFFKESNIYRENGEKMFWRHDHFLVNRVSYAKNEYNFCYYKLDAKYFHVKQCFHKKQ